MTLRAALVAVLHDLEELRVPHAVIGGLAVSARAEPRMTRDVDLTVAVADDAAAEQVIFALTQRGYALAGVLEQSAAGRLATVRLHAKQKPDPGVLIDLLFASSGIEDEVVQSAERITILKGVVAPVATVGHLIALKLLSQGPHRPQDAFDLRQLGGLALGPDWAQAEGAIALIVSRGFARGRDLVAALAMLREPA